jgi:hypothetical protein
MSGAAVLTFSAEGAERLYVLRDGIPIADVTGLTEYFDHSALDTMTYVLRAVDASDNYADSAPATVTISVPSAMLAAVDALNETVKLMLTRGEPRRISGSIAQGVSYQYYAGRVLPVAVFSGQESESYQLSIAFRYPAERDAVLALIRRRKVLLYRDKWGNRWFVTAATTGYDQDHVATSLALSLDRVDHIEEIQYAEV